MSASIPRQPAEDASTVLFLHQEGFCAIRQSLVNKFCRVLLGPKYRSCLSGQSMINLRQLPPAFGKLYLTVLLHIQQNYGSPQNYNEVKPPALPASICKPFVAACLKFGEPQMARVFLQNPTAELALDYLRLAVEDEGTLPDSLELVRLLMRYLLENGPSQEALSALPAKFWEDLWMTIANYDPVFPDEEPWEGQADAQLEFLSLSLAQGLHFDCTALFNFRRPIDTVAQVILLPQIREPGLRCRVQAELQRSHPELFSSRLP